VDTELQMNLQFPTIALDVTTQGKILQLLKEMNKKYGMSILLLISHNLRVIQSVCNRAIVIKDDKVVESGMTKELFAQPPSRIHAFSYKKFNMTLSQNNNKNIVKG